MGEKYSETVEDYLKAICQIGAGRAQVTTTVLAERLAVSPASATNMIKKLAGLKLAVHQPYRGVSLTETGQTIAQTVIRRYRLVERYLIEHLGLTDEQAQAYAEKWEHLLSAEVEAGMDAALQSSTVECSDVIT